MKVFFKNRLATLGLIVLSALTLLAVTAPWVLEALDLSAESQDIFARYLKPFESSEHPLGTDDLGRDVFARLLYGARVSLTIALAVAVISGFISLVVGSLSGFYGGWVDTFLMRFTDSVISLPLIAFCIVLTKIDFTKIPLLGDMIAGESESIYKLVFILCLFSWMPGARLVRGQIISIKGKEFVQSARALGAGDGRILVRHLLPNSVQPLFVAMTLGVGQSIMFEAALSFLGLGIQPPTPSWGNMLNNAQQLIAHTPHLAILPGICIFLTVVSFNLIGDGLQDALDPKL